MIGVRLFVWCGIVSLTLDDVACVRAPEHEGAHGQTSCFRARSNPADTLIAHGSGPTYALHSATCWALPAMIAIMTTRMVPWPLTWRFLEP